MKILWLGAYFEPEQTASTHLERDLLTALSQAGHEVEVICPRPTRGISDEVAEAYKNRRHETLYGGRVRVTRFWAPREGKNTLLRAFRYFWCNLREYQLGRKAVGVDVIYANSTPPTQGLLMSLLKKKQKKPCVYCLQDIFPDSLVTAGMTTRDSLIWKIGRWVESKGYAGADRIITISDDFFRNITQKGVPEEKIEVIPNWINTDSVRPVSREENILFDRYGLDRESFYICYSGNLGHSQNLTLLVQAAKALQNQLPEVKFVLIGEGAAKESLLQSVAQEQLTNVIILPFQPYEEIAHVFSLGDVGLIISKPGIGSSSVPSKTWSIMAAQRPVLASFDRDSRLAELIDQLNIGITAQAGDLEALLEAIRTLYGSREQTARMGAEGRTYVSQTIAREKCVGRYLRLMESLARK